MQTTNKPTRKDTAVHLYFTNDLSNTIPCSLKVSQEIRDHNLAPIQTSYINQLQTPQA